MTRDEKRKEEAVIGYRQAALHCRLNGDVWAARRFEYWAFLVERSAWAPPIVKTLVIQRVRQRVRK